MTKAAEDNQAFAPPEEVDERHIVEEFQRLIEADATKTVNRGARTHRWSASVRA